MFNLALTKRLSIVHVFLIAMSNLLVQYPFELFGYHTTWGAFTYPMIFITTDLTTRITSANIARKIVFNSMIPGLFISYVIASAIESNSIDFYTIHPMPLRIAEACFIAYAAGQLLDIFVFQRYRNRESWWLAPMISTTLGNIVDTILFFSIAFYHCSHPFLSQHWPEIAATDMFFKITMSLVAFVPLYGLILGWINTPVKD
jgi:queuosine precursor transporter